jgi:hypothetical protein
MLWLWQFPQNILGVLVKLFSKAEYRETYKTSKVFVWKRNGGISLGKYIFVPPYADENYIKHEYGHSIQS